MLQHLKNRVLHSTKHTRRMAAGGVAALALALIYANGDSRAAEAPPAQPAIPVSVATMHRKPVRVWTEFSGRLRAVDAAEIRPEVSGRITKVRFQDGKQVKAGDVLFEIDPRPYEAALAKAKADLASARTNAQFAALELKRASGMIKSKAIAQRVFDERANASRVAAANVKAAEAQLAQAEVDVDHAYVKSPITGRAGRVEITLGNVVQAGPNAPLLTSVVASDAVYADFEVDEQTYLNSIRQEAGTRTAERKIPVKLALHEDGAHSYHGTVYTFDNRIDPTTGTIRARAKFENQDGTLLPGMYVKVQLASGSNRDAIVVPERALGFDQSMKFVLVVNDKDQVEYRPVKLGEKMDDGRIVEDGLHEGERVIVDGLMHVRPGATVNATEASAETLAPAKPTKKS